MASSLLLCLTALLAIYSTAHASPGKRVDCRKFVYHPKCRGVAAKRSDLTSITSHRLQPFRYECRGGRKRSPGLEHPDNTPYRKQADELSQFDQRYILPDGTLGLQLPKYLESQQPLQILQQQPLQLLQLLQQLQPEQPIQLEPLPLHLYDHNLKECLKNLANDLDSSHVTHPRAADSDTQELVYDY